jgi:hypothetical protein
MIKLRVSEIVYKLCESRFVETIVRYFVYTARDKGQWSGVVSCVMNI